MTQPSSGWHPGPIGVPVTWEIASREFIYKHLEMGPQNPVGELGPF